jgi:GNAT superfamily N-acetyltransferase
MEIRSYRNGDEEEITKLAERVFNITMSRELWAWKFLGSPYGDSVITVAEDHGEIVGHCGAIRLDVRNEGRILPAFMGVDAMVAPEYRGKGLFQEIETHLNESYRKRGAALTFSFANPSSSRLLERYGVRQNLGEIESQTKVTNYVKFLCARVSAKVSGNKGKGWPRKAELLPSFVEKKQGEITLESTARFGSEVEDLWHSPCPSSRIMVAKGSEYLNWRYIDHPEKSYSPILVRKSGELVGLIVMGTLEFPYRKGTIADCYFKDGRDEALMKLALAQAVRYIKETGLESVTAWMPSESAAGKVLVGSGFTRRSSEVFLMVTAFDTSLSEVALQKGNWYYTLGDSDVG